MAVVSVAVKAEDRSLTTFNKKELKADAKLKDSVKDRKTDFARVIQILMESGDDQKIGPNIASVVGLPRAMPTKAAAIRISADGEHKENRQCHVAYETGDHSDVRRPVCVYLVRGKRSAQGTQTRYFKLDLNGRLERVIATAVKFDENGQAGPGSLENIDEDINSPEVKKAFNIEMAAWTNDWLKSKQKVVAKKATVNAAKSASAAPPQATPNAAP